MAGVVWLGASESGLFFFPSICVYELVDSKCGEEKDISGEKHGGRTDVEEAFPLPASLSLAE